MSVYADFLRDGCPDLFQPGQIVLCSRANVPVSAEFARARLRAVIAADRAPRGEWVRRGRVIDWQPWVPDHVKGTFIPAHMERARTICRWMWL